MRIFPGQIKSGNFIFSQGNFEEKKRKRAEKSWGIFKGGVPNLPTHGFG